MSAIPSMFRDVASSFVLTILATVEASLAYMRDLLALDWIDHMPRIVGVQATGSSPLVDAWERGLEGQEMRPVDAHSVADSIVGPRSSVNVSNVPSSPIARVNVAVPFSSIDAGATWRLRSSGGTFATSTYVWATGLTKPWLSVTRR